MSILRKFFLILKMIKFEHTVFALPFAIMSAFLAKNGVPTAWEIVWILVAVVGARSAAMAFNRITDAKMDAKNPRTKERAIPTGNIKKGQVWVFVVICSATFILAAGMLNTLCLILSPVALFVILSYSYTKRVTSLSHFILGISLAIAPVGAWLAVKGEFDLVPIVLGTAVMFWVAGFDIIYSCLDFEFDRKEKIFSIPAKVGIKKALHLSALLHGLTVISLLLLYHLSETLNWIYLGGILFILLLLAYEHSIVSSKNLKKANTAFFTVNGIVSIVVMAVALAEVFIKKIAT